MHLDLFKSKYRRKFCLRLTPIIFCTLVIILTVSALDAAKCQDSTGCGGNGKCVNETCVCFEGWQGPECQFCGGKIRLESPTGTIFDGLGNYSIGMKCSWLIDAPNSSITFHLEEFATECGWDYLYIYDGDSVESPLLAALTGLMYKDKYGIKRILEVVANSGSALVHFFSDDAFTMSGFNMTYRLNACPSKVSGKDCSGNGKCIDRVCTCDKKWGGSACHIEKCPNKCGISEGRGYCEPTGCVCNMRFKGDDCGQLVKNGYWESLTPPGFIPPGSASHGAAVWRDLLYIVAGHRYDINNTIYTYDFNGNMWESHHYNDGPSLRYAHSTVLYGDKIYIYGGVLRGNPTSELWAFDINAKTWENVTVKAGDCKVSNLMCGPLKTSGHSATVVTNNNKKSHRMIVIFGYSPYFGFLNTVQEYYFRTRKWHVVNTKGYPVKGGYGHSASYDPYSLKIYVYGGDISENQNKEYLSGILYSYEPDMRIWSLLNEAPSARFLHTATFISPGLMLVFGGNSNNDTVGSSGAKCYSSEVLTYDVSCDAWQVLPIPQNINADISRYGHSAVIFEDSLYIYGGFDGQLLSDLLKYTPGSCSVLKNQTSCLSRKPGVSCVWDNRNSKCVSIQDRRIRNFSLQDSRTDSECTICKCPTASRSDMTQSIINKKQKCAKIQDCTSCVQTTSNCVWCNGNCTYHKECKDDQSITALERCPADPTPICNQLHSCTSCGSNPSCKWEYDAQQQGKCVASQASNITQNTTQCPKVCSEYSSCMNCTEDECIWCQNEGSCIDKNAYKSSYPYGQCRDWTTGTNKCRGGGKEESQCSSYSTCTQCREDPACGWCDDGSRTGYGKCMSGGYAGPTLHTQPLQANTCHPDRWHFTTCPMCQCNGHASCRGNTSVCDACNGLTTGHHCERCIPGYWGSPVNGGKCQMCDCNGHATECNSDTGKCFCTTKGIVGDHCEKCDQANHYNGDPLNNGSCYYELVTDYQFTFNISKKEDRHFTQINFHNSPKKPDIDTAFMITCSVNAKINVTVWNANSLEEKAIYTAHNCMNFKTRFAKAEYKFGVEYNVPLTTFYVHVYDFQSPLWIQVSFAQFPELGYQ